MEYLILWHLASSMGARLNKFHCIALKSVGPLGNILWIRIFSHMEITI
jgi:hypothetical protein